MAVLRKFKAVRPKNGLEEKIASFPYDVINSDEAREIAKGNEYSFLHINKPEIDLPPETDHYAEEVYQKAKENYGSFLKNGWFIQEEKERLYIYRQTMDGREQYGIVGCCSAKDYDDDVIKKHEHTRKVKEEDRIKHVDVTNINAGPIFLTYDANKEIDALVAEAVKKTPVYDFRATDGIGHTVWIIEDDEVSEKIIELFEKTPNLYVADGHHRSASAAMVASRRKAANPNHTGNEEYNFFLSVLFPHDQLHIMDYNRVLKNLNGQTEEQMFAAIDKYYETGEIGKQRYKPAKKGEAGMYFNGEWFKLTIRDEYLEKEDPVKSLDIYYLQHNILDPFFGIKDPRTSDEIDFIGGIRGLQELERLVDSGKFQVAFAMYPTSIIELMNIADAGEVMPPKSTWFEPKLRSGLLVHSLD
ncbi:MAG: DUF1015 domain-containing protein [Candidatus Delongbacteria bacterium]|nr:DUF1015 domain-containing protein [Candidatus Delongbacteria bacterium]